jgi:hypothetical protein
MAKFKPKFTIGDKITVTHSSYGFQQFGRERRVGRTKLATPAEGWVTGYKFLNEGEITRDWWEEGATFATTMRVRVVCYKTFMLAKESYALETDCEIIAPNICCPVTPSYGKPMAEHLREELSRDMKRFASEFPRDEKGRFTRG